MSPQDTFNKMTLDERMHAKGFRIWKAPKAKSKHLTENERFMSFVELTGGVDKFCQRFGMSRANIFKISNGRALSASMRTILFLLERNDELCTENASLKRNLKKLQK